MKHLRPWKPKPYAKLGKGASVMEEASHFVHEMGNRLMVLMMRMEIRSAHRKVHLAERAKQKRHWAKQKRERRLRQQAMREQYGSR